jgi:5-methylcytosine-specific restriction endonuclease McrA
MVTMTNILLVMEKKRCTQCQKDKPLSDFYAKTETRKHSRCIQCMNAYRKKRYRVTRDAEQKKNAAYYAANKEYFHAQRRAYYRANKDAIKARTDAYRSTKEYRQRDKEYRTRNAEKRAKKHRDWHRRNPHKAKEYYRRTYARDKSTWNTAVQNRRARIKANGGNVSAREWRAIKERHGNKCACCGASGSLTMDHVVPLSAGGSHKADNIQPLCRKCNRSKWNKFIDYRKPM